MAKNLVESTIRLLQDHIKSNINAALVDLRAERAEPIVTTEPPLKDSYFIYERAVGYKTPAVFIIADNLDMFKSAGPNSVMALVKVRVSVVVEDVKADHCTIKAWRYQDALFEVLEQAQISSNNNDVKIVVIVQGATFSPVFTNDQDAKSARNTFRKEVVLDLDVRHFERT